MMIANVLDGVMETDLNSALFTGKARKLRPGPASSVHARVGAGCISLGDVSGA